jgi:2-dehydro-3-deoxyphosphogalactonate aldolase
VLSFAGAMTACPLIAILRGIRPEECLDIGTALVDAGFTLIEVPLNSPEPLKSISRLAHGVGNRALVGGGTVLTPLAVSQVAEAGGRLVVSPNTDAGVLSEAKKLGLAAVPGFATPTEAFLALEAGADALKLFPAEGNSPVVLKSLRAVLPGDVPVLPVGSISLGIIGEYWAAGASGFGLGSAIYQPGAKARDVGRAARAFKEAFELLPPRGATR